MQDEACLVRRHIGLSSEQRHRHLRLEAERILKINLVKDDVVAAIEARVDIVDLLVGRHDAAQLELPAVPELPFSVQGRLS